MLIGILLIFVATSPLIMGLYLDDLEDVTITLPVNCNILHYNGTNWTNYDLWNQTITWYQNHTFNSIIQAYSFYGDGGNLTNITTVGDGFAGNKSHPHNQDLNTTDNVTFQDIYIGDIWNNEINDFIIDLNTSDMLVNSNIVSPILKLYATGETDKRYESASRFRLSIAQNIMGGAWAKLILDLEDYDQNNDHSIFPEQFVAPLDGLYQISYSVYILELPPTGILMSVIYVNGVASGGFEMSESNSWDLANSGADILLLNSGDIVELYVFHNFMGLRLFPNTRESNYMAICKIA